MRCGRSTWAIDLVRQIIAFSKQKDSPEAPYTPGHLLHEVFGSIRNSIHGNLKVVENISADTGKINLAPSLFRTVIKNLCINALDAMGEGHGVLVVSL